MINAGIVYQAIIPAIVSGIVSYTLLTISNRSNMRIKFKEDLCAKCSEIHRIALKNTPEQHEEDVIFYLTDMRDNISRSNYMNVTKKEQITDKLKNLGYQYTHLTRDDKTEIEKSTAKEEIGNNISSIKRIIEGL